MKPFDTETAAASKDKKQIVHEAIGVMQHLSALFLKRRAELASEVGLTEQQWLLLERVTDEHFMPSMFARERESSPAAVSKILRQLMEKGFVESGFNESDARKRDYRLTEKGRQVMASLRTIREKAVDRIWMEFDVKTLAMFCDFGAELIASIESYARKDG